MIRSLMDTKMPDTMGRLSTARIKYAAAFSTKYIAPMGIPRTATSRAAIKMLARIASVTSRNRLLPLLVARASKTLRNTSSAKGVKMRPIVKTCEAGKDRVCHPFNNRSWTSFRSAIRAWQNLPKAFIAKAVLLAEYSTHN